MVTAKNVAPWGCLQPLLRNDAEQEVNRQTHDLALPGSFGREELIRPFLDTCWCRKRPNAVDAQNGLSPSKKFRCEDCSFVRSLAAFIPRKKLLHFSYPSNNVTSHGLVVHISGNNAAQIVRFHPSSAEKGDGGGDGLVVVNDSDEISLHWNGLGMPVPNTNRSSPLSATESRLVRFRVVRFSEANVNEAPSKLPLNLRHDDNITYDTEMDMIDRVKVKPVIPPLSEEAKIQIVNKDWINSNFGAKNFVQPSFHLNDDKHEADSDAKLLYDVGGTEKEIKHSLDVASTTEKAIGRNVESLSLEKYGSGRQSDTEEEYAEPESVPLTLPVNFLASSPRSFTGVASQTLPSLTRNHSQVRKEIDFQVSSQNTPQKSNISVRKKFTGEGYDEFPKQEKASSLSITNVTNECSQKSVPIFSLSFNQLRRLHLESNDMHSVQQSTVRKAALSLTLALTSNASAWDLSFLKECGEPGSRRTNGTGKTQKWMPRLLQGTRIVMCKHDVDS